jgi:hypothetical protein
MIRHGTVVVLLLLLVSSCGKPHGEAPSPSSSEPMWSQVYRQDSVTAIVSVNKTNITTIEEIQLMLEVQVPLGMEVTIPEVTPVIEPFSLSHSFSDPQQTLPNGKILHRYIWVLVPELPGKIIFQPLEISAGSTTLKTGPIAITVNSILPSTLDNFEIKDITAPISLLAAQEKTKSRIQLIAGASVTLLFIGVVIRFIRRPRIVVVTTPHETALQALDQLPEDPVSRIHTLNHILRTYIETRFNLPLIGKTTNEVLHLLEQTQVQDLTPSLIQFFEAGEPIRFSHFVPDAYSNDAEQFVRQFIEATKEEGSCD